MTRAEDVRKAELLLKRMAEVAPRREYPPENAEFNRLNSNTFERPGECFHCTLSGHHAATICHQCAYVNDETDTLLREWLDIQQTAVTEWQRKYADERRAWRDLQSVTTKLREAKYLLLMREAKE